LQRLSKPATRNPAVQLITTQMFLPTSDRKLVEFVVEVMMAAPNHVAARRHARNPKV
jgi:hypothetical protein